jgi:hypothetical protein
MIFGKIGDRRATEGKAPPMTTPLQPASKTWTANGLASPKRLPTLTHPAVQAGSHSPALQGERAEHSEASGRCFGNRSPSSSQIRSLQSLTSPTPWMQARDSLLAAPIPLHFPLQEFQFPVRKK